MFSSTVEKRFLHIFLFLFNVRTHVESQTDANYSNKMNIERQLDKLDIHFQENPE
jgi:hypothetical protein